jgi:hypothetical protein
VLSSSECGREKKTMDMRICVLETAPTYIYDGNFIMKTAEKFNFIRSFSRGASAAAAD